MMAQVESFCRRLDLLHCGTKRYIEHRIVVLYVVAHRESSILHDLAFEIAENCAMLGVMSAIAFHFACNVVSPVDT